MRRKMSLRQLKNRLSMRRTHLIREIERRFQENRELGGHRFTDLADIASNTLRDELSWLVVEEERRELEQIDEALARIKSGSYGICRNCGEPIKKARLEALPFATLCIKCKEVEEEEIELGAKVEAEASLWGESLGNMESDENHRIKEKVKDVESVDSYSHN
ncbi:MAG TPA: TraR/DksA family transcriptional regulator [Candidatus Brocadiia bacterium]|nr:TraR/DksA family transcriptional regulator [Candidatus Brocadiales bacterium]